MFWFKKKKAKKRYTHYSERPQNRNSNSRNCLTKAERRKLLSFLKSNRDHFNERQFSHDSISEEFQRISGIECTVANVSNMIYRKKLKLGPGQVIMDSKKPKPLRRKLSQKQIDGLAKARKARWAKHNKNKGLNVPKEKEDTQYLSIDKPINTSGLSDIHLISLIFIPLLNLLDQFANTRAVKLQLTEVRNRVQILQGRGRERDKQNGK